MLWKQHRRHTHMSAYYYCKRILVLALTTQNATAASISFKLYRAYVIPEIIAEIFLPSNLFSIQVTNANAHISMNLREGCAALYYTLYLFSSFEWYMWLSYMNYAHMYLCVVWFSLSFWVWPLVAISRHLCFHSSVLRTVYFISCWHAEMYPIFTMLIWIHFYGG